MLKTNSPAATQPTNTPTKPTAKQSHHNQALLWFASPPGYYANHTRSEAHEQLASLQAFSQLLSSFPKGGWPTLVTPQPPAGAAAPHPVWGVTNPSVGGYVKLLQVLLQEEVKRIKVWNEPLTDVPGGTPVGVSL